VPPKIARKFKKASPSKKYSDLVPVDEEPVQKGKQVKRPAKKSTTKPATGVVIREALMGTNSKSKEKGKKSLRDFHKTHPSDSGTIIKKPPSVDKITPTVTSEGTGDKPGVPDVTEDDSTEKQEEKSKDDDQEEEEFVHTPSYTDDKDDDNLESESEDVIKSDEEKGMDDNTYQIDDDVDARLKEPTQTDKEVVQGEGADAEMNDAQQGNENLETTQEQVVDDAHVIISTIIKKSEVPVHTIEVPRTPQPTLLQIIALEKEVAEFKKDPVHSQVTTLIDEHLDTRLGETREEFMKFLSASPTERLKEQRGRKDKDKDEDPSAGSDRGLKKRKTNKDVELTTDQEENLGDNDDEPRKETASRHDWFKKPIPPQEPTDPDWHIGKTT
ncbi:hypothetical protein Tco_0018916, partial [Tanacetum coccineum]